MHSATALNDIIFNKCDAQDVCGLSMKHNTSDLIQIRDFLIKLRVFDSQV